MTEPAKRIAAIFKAEIVFRFRKTAAVVTMLTVAVGVYFIVPDLSTGRTLIQVDNARVLYTSAAVALGTGMFCTLFMSLIGFYLISNSFRRDLISRTGLLIAAAPVSTTEYLAGKFLGSALYLGAIMLTCMISSMLMFLIRGEGSLEPFVFIRIYFWLTIPTIAFCSAIALAFESLPLLSGRFGDVLYFFVWAALLGFSAAYIDSQSKPNWLSAMDVVGIIPIIGFTTEQFHTTSMSIGSTSFNASKIPVVMSDLPWTVKLIAQRFSTLVLPAVLLVLARLWFHRFDPGKVKFSIRQARKGFYGRINALLKPATRLLRPLSLRGTSSRASIPNAVWADVISTLSLSPIAIVAIIVFGVISLSVDIDSLRAGVVPAMVVAIIITLADITTRDHAAGVMNLLFTAPLLKQRYVLWKCISALTVVLCFTVIPAARLLFATPNSGLSLLIGSLLMAGAAVGCGVLTRSPKPFAAIFLMLLYIMLNAKDVAFFDFVGIYGKSPASVQLGYAVAASCFIVGAYLKHRSTLTT